jgi:glycosyltransferase involved in cell wall biosynthesis
MASFCLLAALRSFSVPRADTIVLLTNPPLFSALGVLVQRFRKERFVYVLMDMYPDIAVQAGMLRKGSISERISRRISRMTLERADRVVVLGDDMRDVAIREGAAPEKVVIIPNWADPEMIYPIPPEENPLRREWGLGEKFVVEYSGNLGISHFFEDILSTAAELAIYDDLRFVFVGGGRRFKEVEHFVRDRSLENVLLFPYRDKSDLAQSLSVGDVHFVSLRPGFEGLVVPSKAYGIMAAGRPMIYQGNPAGEIARMVSREGIGYVIQPGDRNGLKEAVLSLYKDKEERNRMGSTARAVLEKRYSPETGLRLYRGVLSGTP